MRDGRERGLNGGTKDRESGLSQCDHNLTLGTKERESGLSQCDHNLTLDFTVAVVYSLPQIKCTCHGYGILTAIYLLLIKSELLHVTILLSHISMLHNLHRMLEQRQTGGVNRAL